LRVLDCGCGNGTSVEELSAAGFEVYGIDLGSFRQEHWSERAKIPRVHLLAADATIMPFADRSFDIVFSCGMLEHIGVREECNPEYHVEAVEGQTAQREQFLRESLRVLRPGGVIFVDHPNGSFPIDFWHVDYRGIPRFHWPSERYLPKFGQVRELAKKAAPNCRVEAVSPAGRFTFRRSRRRWYGKVFAGALETYFQVLRYPPFTRLAGTALNPYLVIRISR
jgi:SAM-dependent methyltransferase